MRARDRGSASGPPRWGVVALMIVAAIVLGATVLREPIAYAAQTVDARITAPLDGQGDVRVHEQGTAQVDVTNASVPIKHAGEAVTIELSETGDPYVVPSRKRLVIEYVNGIYFNPLPHAAVLAVEDGSSVNLFRFPGSPNVSDTGELFDPGFVSEAVTIHAGSGATLTSTHGVYSLSGYLLDTTA